MILKIETKKHLAAASSLHYDLQISTGDLQEVGNKGRLKGAEIPHFCSSGVDFCYLNLMGM